MIREPDYVLYIDETGDHTTGVSEDIGKRYLGIAGPFIAMSELSKLEDAMDQIKSLHLPCNGTVPVLHRKEIMQCRGPFSCLGLEGKRDAFNEDLISMVRSIPYHLLAVVIDKNQHGGKRYRTLTHPYHYCLHALLERYCTYLSRFKRVGSVIAEARGKEEDYMLRASYREVYENGTCYLKSADARRTLLDPELTICKKNENVAGLQLADILAHPSTRDVLAAYSRINTVGTDFTSRVVAAFKPRYHRKWDGQINGYGRIFLS